MRVLLLLIVAALGVVTKGQVARKVGRLQEVFAWKQLTYNIDGNQVLTDRYAEEDEEPSSGESEEYDDLPEREYSPGNFTSNREKRQFGPGFITIPSPPRRDWTNNNRPTGSRPPSQPPSQPPSRPPSQPPRRRRPQGSRPRTTRPPTRTRPSTANPNGGSSFIQYNNLPMGVERAGNRLFITLPRRRLGILSTLNYLDLSEDSYTRSPGLRPYPNLRSSLVSVYRTRADHCNRLWMVDTGLLELPNNRQQVQPPAIVVFDLTTDREILRYPFKSSDLVNAGTPAGLNSITVDYVDDDCSTPDVFAYVPDGATYGLIVFSLRERDSWRMEHNYFHFNPVSGNFRVAGQYFQWNDGIFSVTLSPRAPLGGCRTAYFHPMVSTAEFSVSTCTLRNRTASTADAFWQEFALVGDRGTNSQCTMHGYHEPSGVIFFAEMARDAISCWHTGSQLQPSAVEILATDSILLSYPSDLHVTGDELWVMSNRLPTWIYGRLNTNEYNFYVYRANIPDLIYGTVCGFNGRSLPLKDAENDDKPMDTD